MNLAALLNDAMLPAEGQVSDRRIACEDNLSFLARQPEESLSLVCSSPPYGIGKSYERRQSIEEYIEGQRPVIAAIARSIRPDGWVCWQVGNHVSNGEVYPLDIAAFALFRTEGFHLRRRVIWHFGHGLHCKRRFSGRHETVLFFSKSKSALMNHVLEAEPSVWDIPNVKHNHIEKTIHPCSFPVSLAERAVLACSNPGDIVCDPFMGAGSTLIAAARHGRVAIGCDLVQEYVDLTLDRLARLAAGTLKTRPMNKEIPSPQNGKGAR